MGRKEEQESDFCFAAVVINCLPTLGATGTPRVEDRPMRFSGLATFTHLRR